MSLDVKDAVGLTKVLKTTLAGGEHTPHHLVDGTVAVTDNGGSLTVDGTVELGATSLSALENIQVTFPSTQNVSVQNASLAVTGTFWQTTQPVSGTVTANAGTNLNTSALALESTATSIKTAVETLDNAISGRIKHLHLCLKIGGGSLGRCHRAANGLGGWEIGNRYGAIDCERAAIVRDRNGGGGNNIHLHLISGNCVIQNLHGGFDRGGRGFKGKGGGV